MSVYLVGAGPGDPGLITVRGAQLLSRAEVVIFDRLVPSSLVDLAPATAIRIDVGKRPGEGQDERQAQINELLVRYGTEGKLVVRLKGGDPFVFGRGGEEAEALSASRVPFEIVPGVSAAFAVPAAAGIPVTHRGLARTVTVVTGHVGDPASEGPSSTVGFEDAGELDRVDWEALARARGTLVIMMGVQKRAEIARLLIEAGRSPDTPVAVVNRGTTQQQRTVRTDLAGLGDVELDAPSIIVVGEVAALDLAPPGEGDPDGSDTSGLPLSGLSVVVTRAHSQAQGLVSALGRAGARVVALPVLAIADPADGGRAMRRAAARLARSQYEWVVFTSANAVERFVSSLGEGANFAGASVAAVGETTRAALRELGFEVALVPQTHDARSLALAMPPSGGSGPGRVLFPRAADAGDRLVKGLTEKGWEVDDVEVYRTVPAGPSEGATEQALAAAEAADVVTFASPSAVRFYLEMTAGRRVPPVVACIGPVTAKAAAAAGLHVDCVAREQSAEGLVDALAALGLRTEGY